MTQRLYLSPPVLVGADRTLDAEDSHYLVRVMRLKPGARLRCFDGEGSEWAAHLTRANTRASTVELGELLRYEDPFEPLLHLAQGWLKGQAMDQTVQKATELGISDFWPIAASRSNVKLDESRTRNRMRHWRRIARSATEQSERLYFPSIHAPRNLADFLVHAPCEKLLFLEPGCEPIPTSLPLQAMVLLVGPEGGWTSDECAMAKRAKADFRGMGGLVLRAETAPLAALAAVRHSWHWR